MHSTKFPRYAIPLTLFFSCLMHRAIQLHLLWPKISQYPLADDHVMQLLPAIIWRENFGAGLLYLQQAPPIPNLVFGCLAWLIDNPELLALALLGFQALLASTSVALMASLMLRMRLPAWASLLVPAILFFSSDTLLMEYNALGHFYYEHSAMLLCLLACHSALSYQRSCNPRHIIFLGVWVALLALTRSTFSYFFVPVLLWISITEKPTRARTALLFLLPVILLQGGWSLKNQLVHGYFSIATSSWGGANARTGDIRRSGGDHMIEWLSGQEKFCDTASWEIAQQYKRPVFFFPDKDWLLSYPQPDEVLEANQRMAEARGREVFYDTETIRLLSHCLQRIYVRYWLHNPLQTLAGAWRSYQVFWLPIREFAARNPIPLSAGAIQSSDQPMPSLWLQQALEEWHGNDFRYAYLDLAQRPLPFSYEDAELLVLPSLPLLVQTINFLAFHIVLAFIVIGLFYRPARLSRETWLQLGFPLMCVLYVAAMTSLVEYGENMRFRIEVEPLIWLISTLAITRALAHLTRRWPSARNIQKDDGG